MADELEPVDGPGGRHFEGRLDRSGRSPLVTIAILVSFLGLAIAKPWAVLGPAADPGATSSDLGRLAPGRAGPPLTRPAGTPGPTPVGAAVLGVCHDPGSWRTTTIETWHDQTVRVWRALDPGPASGPLDESIDIVPAVGVTIPAIGFCAPTSGDEQPTGPARVTAWHVVDGVARTIRLRQIAPVGVTTPFGALYGPATGGGRDDEGTAPLESWPSGRVVFRYVEAGTVERWFGIEIILMDAEPAADQR